MTFTNQFPFNLAKSSPAVPSEPSPPKSPVLAASSQEEYSSEDDKDKTKNDEDSKNLQNKKTADEGLKSPSLAHPYTKLLWRINKFKSEEVEKQSKLIQESHDKLSHSTTESTTRHGFRKTTVKPKIRKDGTPLEFLFVDCISGGSDLTSKKKKEKKLKKKKNKKAKAKEKKEKKEKEKKEKEKEKRERERKLREEKEKEDEVSEVSNDETLVKKDENSIEPLLSSEEATDTDNAYKTLLAGISEEKESPHQSAESRCLSYLIDRSSSSRVTRLFLNRSQKRHRKDNDSSDSENENETSGNQEETKVEESPSKYLPSTDSPVPPLSSKKRKLSVLRQLYFRRPRHSANKIPVMSSNHGRRSMSSSDDNELSPVNSEETPTLSSSATSSGLFSVNQSVSSSAIPTPITPIVSTSSSMGSNVKQFTCGRNRSNSAASLALGRQQQFMNSPAVCTPHRRSEDDEEYSLEVCSVNTSGNKKMRTLQRSNSIGSLNSMGSVSQFPPASPMTINSGGPCSARSSLERSRSSLQGSCRSLKGFPLSKVCCSRTTIKDKKDSSTQHCVCKTVQNPIPFEYDAYRDPVLQSQILESQQHQLAVQRQLQQMQIQRQQLQIQAQHGGMRRSTIRMMMKKMSRDLTPVYRQQAKQRQDGKSNPSQSDFMTPVCPNGGQLDIGDETTLNGNNTSGDMIDDAFADNPGRLNDSDLIMDEYSQDPPIVNYDDVGTLCSTRVVDTGTGNETDAETNGHVNTLDDAFDASLNALLEDTSKDIPDADFQTNFMDPSFDMIGFTKMNEDN